jgi:hypothetical protein
MCSCRGMETIFSHVHSNHRISPCILFSLTMSADDDKAAKKARKAALKAEADKLGISYEEHKKSLKKGGKREASSLDTKEHQEDMKRMRTWSKDLGVDEQAAKKRRTRSMDAEEGKKVETEQSPEAWRAEHSITVRGHGSAQGKDIERPFRQFSEAPFGDAIQRAIKTAGYATPTHIQSQVSRSVGIHQIHCVDSKHTNSPSHYYRLGPLPFKARI